ncbi:MAG: hypothetical protein RRY76_04410, partial [Clostridia bacterium]
FAAACDDALIVSLHRSTAVRAAERTGIKLSEVGFKNLRLIVNGYDRVKSDSGELPTLFEIINRSAIKLLGAVPFSESLISDQENGVLALSSKERRLKTYEAAFLNTALRITGENVPLLENVYFTAKRKNIYRKYGRIN